MIIPRRLKRLDLKSLDHLALLLRTSPQEIRRLCQLVEKRPRAVYREFPKPVNGKLRQFAEPLGRLKVITKAINRLLQRIVFPANLYGGLKGRSCGEFALPHVGAPGLLKIDIKDCFPSVRPRMVYEAFVERLGCSPDVARCLTRLTTLHGSLPQGSPTSAAVLNLVFWHRTLPRMQGLSESIGARYGAYMDDSALSGPAWIGNRRKTLKRTVARIYREGGFKLNLEKTKALGLSEDRILVGIQVNASLDVPSTKEDLIRKRISDLKCFGSDDVRREVKSIEGQIGWVHTINPHLAEDLRRELSLAKSGASAT